MTTRPHFHVGPHEIRRLDSELTSGHDSSSLAGDQLAAAAAGIPPTADTSTALPRALGVSAIPDEAMRDRAMDFRDEHRRGLITEREEW